MNDKTCGIIFVLPYIGALGIHVPTNLLELRDWASLDASPMKKTEDKCLFILFNDLGKVYV